jgi:hypothetical protein
MDKNGSITACVKYSSDGHRLVAKMQGVSGLVICMAAKIQDLS